ncbi:MAG: aminotransferase [Pseudomonas sp.]|nr:aminotransferase [Pseudomonas sp.]
MSQPYSMQEWVFREAYGKYDIDLGDSNAPCIKAGIFSADIEHLVLDYGTDRGGNALAKLVAKLYGIETCNIGIAHGAQEALYLLYRTLLNAGDHVITFSPGWQQSWKIPEEIGCSISALEYDANFKVSAESIHGALRPNTRAIILNNPSNPTGKAINGDQLKQIVDMARERNIFIISDEEYLTDMKASTLHFDYDNVITVSGVSKIFGAPGIRVGWMCGPKDIVAKAMDYKHFTTISNSVICEKIAERILLNYDALLNEYLQLCRNGYEVLQQWSRDCFPMLEVVAPEGTPFCWVHLTSAESSLDFCRRILHRARVLTMPAEVFGQQHGMRITFARPVNELTEGLARIKSEFKYSLPMY